MPEDYRSALVAGFVSAQLQLPGGLVGRQRVVRVSLERLRHIAIRRPDWLLHCLLHMADVIGRPQYLGFRPRSDPKRVEFVRGVGPRNQLLLVAIKFLDAEREAWVSTAHPLGANDLTRRLRADTMQKVSRGP